ncbi:MAG: discoidin domain-containing protein [bacterium]
MYCIPPVTLLLLLTIALSSPMATGAAHELANESYRLTVTSADGEITVRLYDELTGRCVAEGPYMYRAAHSGMTDERLENASITTDGDQLTIRGKIAGLDLEHIFALPADHPFMEERISLRNSTNSRIELTHFEAGLSCLVTDKAGDILSEYENDRWIAIPFRHRADDPEGYFNDFSTAHIVTNDGYEPRIDENIKHTRVPSPNYYSEGWAWVHGDCTLGIFKFNQENMEYSALSKHTTPEGRALRFGGACMMIGEPAALTRMEPGQVVNLGATRYQSIKGGYTAALYAYRRLLDEKGCRFPKDYNPPVHWNQLYNMSGAWDDRANKYTKAIVEQEAVKARDYSCESLYLDPGWDTDFATFLWGEKWLGPRKQFIQEMKTKYGLQVSLHCPLATWMSHDKYTWGKNSTSSWPEESRRIAPPRDPDPDLMTPATRDGHRNLALLPTAKPNASSCIKNYDVHKIEYLNSGWYGNDSSWVAESTPAWAEIDLGEVYTISKVCLGNDRSFQYKDRAATEFRILVAIEYSADSSATTWQTVAKYTGKGIQGETEFGFEPTSARWVRVDIMKTAQGDPVRIDEIEIHEHERVSKEDAISFERSIQRGSSPSERAQGPSLCLGSKQYREVAEERLLANCADGVVFLMFDGNWWNGGCLNPNHGHPVPYRMADHIDACVELAQRVHAQYPNVLIEMHDMLAGGTRYRMTPVYYKYGLPGSYDDNWGFELMWDPLVDLKEGRGASLHYYNMACNVPAYLHVDISKDNEHCLVVWWFASTCRHLGIGGTHPNPAIVEAQKKAMKRYRELDRFYKRGEFFGMNEEIHLHVLPEENAFVVNLFNLSNETRTISGSMNMEITGLDTKLHYAGSEKWGEFKEKKFEVKVEMPPWSAEVGLFTAD